MLMSTVYTVADSIYSGASILTLLQIVVAILAGWYFLKRVYKKKLLSDEERQFRLDSWNPRPICGEVCENNSRLSPRIVDGKAEFYISVNGKECLNLATHNYLSLNDNVYIRKTASDSIKRYGIGSAGPRGFYGTLDVHLELEERLAQFMNAESAVIYSYGFSTSASAIPAYCKRKDVIFADEMIHFAARKGIQASRSTVYYFKHNDMEHLEFLLNEQKERQRKNPQRFKKTSLFLIVEGIYFNTGTLCPLPKVVEFRKKYKMRLFLDENQTFGVLGATGRGISEYFNVDRETEIDLIMSTLETAIGSTGGFCVGSHFITEHQRLSGLGYCFSASCPPLLCKAAIEALNYIEQKPEVLKILQNNCAYFQKQLNNVPYLKCISDYISPVKHLQLRYISDYDKADTILCQIVLLCEDHGFAVTKSEFLDCDPVRTGLAPSIRVTVNVKLTKTDINDFVDCLIKIQDRLFL